MRFFQSRAVLMIAKRIIDVLFAKAGITAEDIRVNNPFFYSDLLFKGSLGLGNSYMEGKWDSDQIDVLVFKILTTGVYQKLARLYGFAQQFDKQFRNPQDRNGAKQVIEEHYDLPSSLYASFLDPYMQYTCGFFEGTDSLDQAQINKMDLICRKLKLTRGSRVMDIGCGWGGLVIFMHEKYGALPTAVTLSEEQANWIKKRAPHIEVLVCDYRDLPKVADRQFDAVSAVGVLEHVGHKNYSEFMGVVSATLRRGRRALVHTLFTPKSRPASDPWLTTQIFPNGELPPKAYVWRAAREHSLEPCEEDFPTFQELTPHYDPTLLAWDDRFMKAIRNGLIVMSEQERRKWHFYFLACAGAIRARFMGVGQFLFQKP